MIPIAYACFVAFDTFALITGGFIRNIVYLFASFGPAAMFVIGAFLAIGVVCMVPIHWALINQPNNVLLLLALVLPWIITCSISSALFAHSPRGGIHTSIAIGIGYFIIMLIPYLVLSLLLSQAGLGGNLIVDNLIMGITGLPWILSALTATMEGTGVGAVFAALVGSLKYKPEESQKKPKKAKKSKDELKEMPEPTFEIKDRCEKCGNALLPTDDFCTECGTKKKKRS